MALILPFDTETTSIPDFKAPSEGPDQPHLVSLAALLVDFDTRETIDQMDVIIKPDGWTWDENNEAFKVHGITVERAMDEGIPEAQALEQFMALYDRCCLRVAFNTTFDNRLIRIAQKRYWPEREDVMEEWKSNKERYYCTMIKASKVIGGKWPTLQEATRYFFNRDHVDAHTAMADNLASLEIFWELQKHPHVAVSADYMAKFA